MPARTAWLLEIGRRLRAEYTALQEPVPERLAELIKQLEAAKTNPQPKRMFPKLTKTSIKLPLSARGQTKHRTADFVGHRLAAGGVRRRRTGALATLSMNNNAEHRPHRATNKQQQRQNHPSHHEH
jgi:hypothetical protein